MQQSYAIFVGGKTKAASRHIIKVFEAANCLNPMFVFGDVPSLQKLIRNNCPLLILVDLSIRAVWEILELLQRERDGCGYPVIALVDDETECLLDRAYETGVRTYLRRPFTFAEFIERARLMRLQFRLQKLPEF